MPEQTEKHGEPFPRTCVTRGKEAVWPATVDYDAKVRHEGRLYEFHVPNLQANRCRECGETTFGNVADEQITHALREHLGLLKLCYVSELPPELHVPGTAAKVNI